MDRKQVASILDEIGTLMELKGENPFKCSAYHNAARVISGLQQDLKTLVGSGQLSKVKGIGEALSKKITEIVTTGKSAYLDELRQSFPDGLLAILQLPGLGPKKVKALYEKLGVSSVAELEYACTENRLIELEGFGQKSQEKILKAIEHYKKTSDMFLYSFASEHAESLMNQMRDLKAVMRVSVVGSLRRRNEIVKDIDLLVSTREIDRDKVVRVFPSLADVEEVVSSTAAAVHVILRSGIHAELTLVDDEQFPYALHYVTGSKKYLEDVKRWGIERKMEISEHGSSRMANFFSANQNRRFSGILDCSTFLRSCAKAMAKSSLLQNGRYRSWWKSAISKERSTAIRITAMASTRLKRWQRRRGDSASNILASPIIASQPSMLMV